MTGFNKFFLVFFALFLTFQLASAPAQAAAPDYAKILSQQAELPLIYAPTSTRTAATTHRPALPEAGKIRIYWFWGAKCPCAKKSEATLHALAQKFPDVEIIVVHANADETPQLAKTTLTERRLSLPVYRDHNAQFATALNARATPEAYLFDHKGIIYQGRTDTLMTGGPEHNWIIEALQQYLAKKTVKPDSRRAIGCAITRP